MNEVELIYKKCRYDSQTIPETTIRLTFEVLSETLINIPFCKNHSNSVKLLT